MTRINKSKDGIIGPKPEPASATKKKAKKKVTKKKAKKKAKKKFKPVMKAKKTRK